MEVLSPTAPCIHSSGLFVQQSIRRSPYWTNEENKRFEKALAEIDDGTPDRWEKVSRVLPGKTPEDVKRHYQDLESDVSHIEAGLIPPPGYSSPPFFLDRANSRSWEGQRRCYVTQGGKGNGVRPFDQGRKKGIPWTEDEHKRFLMGLKKFGKGDWRNISRNFVISRTPTQVASHAQKYFIRLSSSGKDRRRPSIHDITTVDVSDPRPPCPPQPSAISACFSSSVGSSTPTSEIYDSTEIFAIHGSPYDNSPFGVKSGAQGSQLSRQSSFTPSRDTKMCYSSCKPPLYTRGLLGHDKK